MFLGGAVGAAVAFSVLQRFPGLFAACTVTVVTSFLLGAVNAAFPDLPRVTAFAGLGVLGTASSFVVVGGQLSLTAPSARSALAFYRRVTSAMALQAILCITFVTVGYLAVDFTGLLYRKLIWG